MTNEEKAYEISQSPLIEDGIWHYATAEIVAIEMAAWKDQQFKEYLEKKKTEMLDKRRKGEVGSYYKRRMVEEIINELFKEG